jgi:RHS repeat-associated protein
VTYTQRWDEENRLVTVTVMRTPPLSVYTVTFGYDADGQLARRTTWQGTTITQTVVYLGPAYEVNATTGVTTSYYFFGGQRVAMRQGAVVYWLHGDHLGSASLTTSGSGQIVSQQRYKPHGQTRWISGTIPTDWRFTDQRSDEASIGLYDYKARYLDPRIGRFVSADTIVPEPGNPQSYNKYAYTLNNPLRYTDPDGNATDDVVSGWMSSYGPWLAVGSATAAAAVYYSDPGHAAQAQRTIESLTLTSFPLPSPSPLLNNTAGEMPKIDVITTLSFPLGPAVTIQPDSFPVGKELSLDDLHTTTPLMEGRTLGLLGGPLLSVKPWEVGEYGKLREKSDPADGLDIHHVPQKHPAQQVIPRYDPWTAPAIAVPQQIHREPLNSQNTTGMYRGTPAELVRSGINGLRSVGAPAKSIAKPQRMINRKYREVLSK